MIDWTDEQLEEAGIDKKKLQSLVRRLRKISREMSEMGLWVYGASGTGCLVHKSRGTHDDTRQGWPDYGSVVADIGRGFDGGDW